MSILDQIRKMKKEGLSEQEISNNLQEYGVSPKAIIDAFDQSKIKDAVEGEENEINETSQQEFLPPQPSSQETYAPSQHYTSSAHEISSNYQPETNPQEQYYSPQKPVYSQEETGEYFPQEESTENYASGGISADNTIEIAEQIFEEYSKKIEKQLDNLKEFSMLAGAKLSNFEERIKKIESIIDNLQIKILEKIGSYGGGLDSIKKEMTMMQNSFSKMVPELAKKQIYNEKTTNNKPTKKVFKKK